MRTGDDAHGVAELVARDLLTSAEPQSGGASIAGSPIAIDAARGALIGTAVGDALGRPAEGQSAARIVERYGWLDDYRPWRGWRSGPKGTITDDTQMTMCVAENLLAHGGRVDPADLARRFVEWYPTGRGKGSTCSAAVHELMAGTPWYRAGQASAGNGAAMRAAPIGIALAHDDALLRYDAALSAVVTHADPMAVVATVAHAWLVARLLGTAPGSLDPAALVDDLVDAVRDLPDAGAPERDWLRRPGKTARPVRLVERLGEVPQWLGRSADDALGWFYTGAFVLETLPAALWCFLESPEDPETAIVRAVMGGHDADTVASMVGAYCGAYLGVSALPERWTGDDLEYAAELRDTADRLVRSSPSTMSQALGKMRSERGEQ